VVRPVQPRAWVRPDHRSRDGVFTPALSACRCMHAGSGVPLRAGTDRSSLHRRGAQREWPARLDARRTISVASPIVEGVDKTRLIEAAVAKKCSSGLVRRGAVVQTGGSLRLCVSAPLRSSSSSAPSASSAPLRWAVAVHPGSLRHEPTGRYSSNAATRLGARRRQPSRSSSSISLHGGFLSSHAPIQPLGPTYGGLK
jgi:hypothetical protein